jgi:hypothetical protein
MFALSFLLYILFALLVALHLVALHFDLSFRGFILHFDPYLRVMNAIKDINSPSDKLSKIGQISKLGIKFTSATK